jgi:uncharacterized repeat protein (TIGR01451 family)
LRNIHEAHRSRAVGAVLVVTGVLAMLVGTSTAASGLEPGVPVVTLEDGTSGCNGVLPTPGSANTTKRLDPNFASDFNPGGVVGYIIDYPVDAGDVSGRETFVITDCVFVDDDAVAKYSVSFVPNTVEFQLRFSVPIASDTPLGAQFCNYAKTTAAPSESQASNRKAGPACFTVGGGLRIEKRSGSTTGPLLPGASFTVSCAPAVTQPPTIITGLSQTSHTNADGTVSASGTSATGTIAVNGPSGTVCTVTETAAPAGYQLDPTPRTLTIPVGTSQTVNVFVNLQFGDLVITKTTSGGTGTFTFQVDCDGTADDQSVTIDTSGSKTISGIPTTSACTVTERANPLFTSASVPGDGKVTIGASPVTVAFTNTARPTGVTLDKKVNGADHATTGDALAVHAGDPLTYTVVIRNSGQVPVSLAALTDSLEPAFAAACPQGVGSTLAAGASFTCTYRATATGTATNVAAVVVVDGLSRRSSASDSTFVRVINPAIAISKTADPPSASEGGVVTFSYAVTNTGDTALRDVTVTDDVLGGIGVIGDLAPGATATLTKSQTVTATSPTRNIGTATGRDVLGRTVTATDPADITVVLGVLIELPRTGGWNIPLLAIAGFGSIISGLVLLGHSRKPRTA